MHQRDIPTVSVAEAAKLLKVHANTIRYRLTKGTYKHSKAVTPTGEVYMIDARDFYRQHPAVAPEGWPPEELEGGTGFVGDAGAIDNTIGIYALEPTLEPPTGVEALRRLDVMQDALERIQEALRVSHEDSQMLRQQVTQMQQQQAVIYHEVRQQRGRGVLRRLLGL